MQRDIATIIGVIVLVILFLSLLGGGMMMTTMMPWMMGWSGFGFSPLWWLPMLLFWALIIGGIALLVAWLFRQGRPIEAGPGPGVERALDILKERYARGEITREQYEQMRHDLEGK